MHPNDIAQTLGLDATAMSPRDLLSRRRPQRETNLWKWSTERTTDTTDPVLHIQKIIEYVTPSAQKLRALQNDGCQTDIIVFWVSSGQGGPEMGVDTMRALVELNLPIWWDIYFGNRDEYSA